MVESGEGSCALTLDVPAAADAVAASGSSAAPSWRKRDVEERVRRRWRGSRSAGRRAAEAAKCSVDTTGVAFGTYNVFATAPTDSTGTIVYSCNGGAKSVVIGITAGQSGSFSTRTLRKGTETFTYNLVSDAARSAVWGDGTGGGSDVRRAATRRTTRRSR